MGNGYDRMGAKEVYHEKMDMDPSDRDAFDGMWAE